MQRGGKHTAYEGGVRVTGFVHGSALFKDLPRPLGRHAAAVEHGVRAAPERVSHDSADIAARGSGTGGNGGLLGSTYSGMMHVVDWVDTICEAAGCAAADLNATLKRDGASQWAAITTGAPSPHNRLVLDLEHPSGKWADYGAGAVRVGDWKLLVGDNGQFKRPGDWSPPDPWDNSMRCEPTTYNGSSPLQLFHLPSDPSERYDWVLDASYATNATLQAVVAEARSFFDAEVAVAHFPQHRGPAGKPVDVGGPIKVWQPWLDLPPTPAPPPSPAPTPPPMPVPGQGRWVLLDGCFTDADCPNVHKGNLAHQTIATCQAACLSALANATASKKCSAINFNSLTQVCVLRQCAQGKKPSEPTKADIAAYMYE